MSGATPAVIRQSSVWTNKRLSSSCKSKTVEMACGSRLDLQNTAAISALAWEYLECANGFVNMADPWKYARIPQEQRSRPSCLSLATLHNQRSVPNELGNPKKGLGTPLVT